MSEYKEDLLNEIEELKKEHETLKQHVRPETLDLMDIKSPDTILNREKTLFTIKSITAVILATAIVLCLGLLVSSFMEGTATPFAEDESIKDETFIPDETSDLNETGSGTGLPSIALQGNYAYFAKEGTVYKYSNGNNTELISANATNLNAYKYCIYFYDPDTDNVCRVRTDGEQLQVIAEDVKITDLKVYKNTAYMLTEDGDINTVYINGKDGHTVSSGKNILAFTVANGYIYYIVNEPNGYALYRMKTSGAESIKVSATDTAQLAADDGSLYYIYEGTLFAFSTEKEKAFALFAGKVEEFTVLNHAVAILADGEVYTVNRSGSNIKRRDLSTDSLSSIPAETLLSIDEEYTKEGLGNEK